MQETAETGSVQGLGIQIFSVVSREATALASRALYRVSTRAELLDNNTRVAGYHHTVG
jgi:hypothetical protein